MNMYERKLTERKVTPSLAVINVHTRTTRMPSTSSVWVKRFR